MKGRRSHSYIRPTARRGTVVLLGLLLLLLIAPASQVVAHGSMLRTTPVAGSVMTASPPRIELYVSETIGLEFSKITLYDRARREQPLGPLGRLGNDDATVTADVLGTLPSGTYTVVWRVLSVVDGHLTAGSFSFRIRGAAPVGASGTPEPEEPIEPVGGAEETPFEGSGGNPDPFRWVIRGIILGGSVFLLGGPLIALLVVEPTVRERGLAGGAVSRAAGGRLARVGALTSLIVLLALIVDLLLQVAAIGNSDILGALGRGDLGLLVVQTTRYGFSWALKVAAAAVLAGIMLVAWLRRGRGQGMWELAIAGASLLLLAQSLGSHAAAVTGSGLILGFSIPIVNDWLHMVTVGSWVGGLAYLALVLFPAFRDGGLSGEERRLFLGRAIPRFSKLAIASVVVLALSGTYNLLIHSTDLVAILGSQYGQVLALKVGLFILLVVVGAVNLRRLSPRLTAKAQEPATSPPGGPAPLAATETASVGRLRRNVRVEVMLAVFALLCAGGLTLLPPPSSRATSGQAANPNSPTTPSAEETALAVASLSSGEPEAIPTPGPATVANSVGGYDFALKVVPSLEGDELTLDVGRSLAASQPLTDVSKVLFKITPQDVDAGSTSYEAVRQGDVGPDRQTWKATETILTVDGGYLVTAIVQRTQSPDVKVAFRLDLSIDTGLRASPAEVVDIGITTDPSPAKSGAASLIITMVDGSRTPIENAKVIVNPFMPAHAHVEPESEARPVEGRPGVYTSTVEFDMGGAWLFILNIQRDGLPPLKTDASLQVIGPTVTPKVSPATGTTPSPTP